MIPADHISIDGDLAWLVFIDNEHNDSAHQWDMLDRQCDTCGGAHSKVSASAGYWQAGRIIRVAGGQMVTTVKCPDCIDGRHTFEIETMAEAVGVMHGWEKRTHRVSVVKGMVLSIVTWVQYRRDMSLRGPFIYQDGDRWMLYENSSTITETTLPPTAAPGMWAVQLRLRKTSQ